MDVVEVACAETTKGPDAVVPLDSGEKVAGCRRSARLEQHCRAAGERHAECVPRRMFAAGSADCVDVAAVDHCSEGADRERPRLHEVPAVLHEIVAVQRRQVTRPEEATEEVERVSMAEQLMELAVLGQIGLVVVGSEAGVEARPRQVSGIECPEIVGDLRVARQRLAAEEIQSAALWTKCEVVAPPLARPHGRGAALLVGRGRGLGARLGQGGPALGEEVVAVEFVARPLCSGAAEKPQGHLCSVRDHRRRVARRRRLWLALPLRVLVPRPRREVELVQVVQAHALVAVSAEDEHRVHCVSHRCACVRVARTW
mmetsp:Transcript_207/g.707  ORF Transcript_207/g.707 Transcript_207/m.707 type:complete len:314 (-) Transcript_207:890-1831(-)